MSTSEWIAIAGIALLYGSSIIGFWMNIKIKINELDIKIKALEKDLTDHVKWGEAEQQKNEMKFDGIQTEIKTNYKELGDKMDTMIEKFNTFQVYCEKNFKK